MSRIISDAIAALFLSCAPSKYDKHKIYDNLIYLHYFD